MSMRGNNIPFTARWTAFRIEMILGTFQFGDERARYRTYRRALSTPFVLWRTFLWWETLFGINGASMSTPEERVGALVWRMHRSARVIFTMNFHLGKWTPQQCVQHLIDNVGFDSENDLAKSAARLTVRLAHSISAYLYGRVVVPRHAPRSSSTRTR